MCPCWRALGQWRERRSVRSGLALRPVDRDRVHRRLACIARLTDYPTTKNMTKEIAVGALAGGNSNNGGNAGPFNLNSNNAPSNANANIGASHVIYFLAAILLPKGKHFTSRQWRAGNGCMKACRRELQVIL